MWAEESVGTTGHSEARKVGRGRRASVSALREDDAAPKEETALLFPAQRSPESGQGRTQAKPVPQQDKGPPPRLT